MEKEVVIEYWLGDLRFVFNEKEQEELINEFFKQYNPNSYDDEDEEEIKKIELSGVFNFDELASTYAFKDFLRYKYRHIAEEIEEMRER